MPSNPIQASFAQEAFEVTRLGLKPAAEMARTKQRIWIWHRLRNPELELERINLKPIKLETRLRPNSAGIPYTLLLRIEAIWFPTFWLLL